jgi:hypothetical protein
MMKWKRPIVGVVFVVVAYLFGNLLGLAVGAILVLVSIIGRLEAPRLWPVAVGLMCLAPFALLAQGLSSAPVAGPSFGAKHMLAHALVGMSLATAAWAGLLELTAGAPDHLRLRATPRPTR